MEQLIGLLARQSVPFMLVYARILGIFMTAPVFSSRSIPNNIRASLALAISFMFYFTLQPRVVIPTTIFVLVLMIMSEIMTGALIGYVGSIIISAIQAAGEIIDVQMGLSMVQLLNPATRTQSSAIGRIFFQLALIILITVNGHLQILGVVFNSFSEIPLGHFSFASAPAWIQFINASNAIFVIAVQLALPSIVVLFLIDFSLGIVNRVAQQIDIFSLGMNIKPLTGYSILLLLTPSMIPFMGSIMTTMAGDMIGAMQKMALALAHGVK